MVVQIGFDTYYPFGAIFVRSYKVNGQNVFFEIRDKLIF